MKQKIITIHETISVRDGLVQTTAKAMENQKSFMANLEAKRN